MRRLCLLFAALVIFLMQGKVTPTISAQSTGNTLIVTVKENDEIRPFLAKYDLATGQFSAFYQTDFVAVEIESLHALRWSPLGNYLAVLEIGGDTLFGNSDPNMYPSTRICILRRNGLKTICLNPAPAVETFDGYANFIQAHNLTWSPDERFIYYSVRNESNLLHRDLIEVATETGQRTRTIFTDTSGTTAMFSWTPTLDTVLLASGAYYAFESDSVKIGLFKTLTGEFIDMRAIAMPYGDLDILCPNTSPDGQYFVALTITDFQSKILLINTDGSIRKVLDGATSAFEQAQCPTWQGQANKLYFWGAVDQSQDYSLFAYDIDSNALQIWHRGENIGRQISRGSFSFDGVYWGVTVMGANNFRVALQTVIVSESGLVLELLAPYIEISSPLWIPPLI
jgi:Tol biopolymer transport system component